MIDIQKLTFSYGKSPVLENITMQLKEGQIYGLLGENGVGKTTLLTLLCGLKKPQSGSITTDGFEPFAKKPTFLASQYFLPDEVAPIAMTAKKFAATNSIFYPDYEPAKFEELMKVFEVDPGKRLDKMSTGQLKKTYISFALSINVKYLFMDEPTNGLDIPSKSQLRSVIMKYTREDSTIVISTHQVKDLENLIDPIIILDTNRVLLDASIEEITKKLTFDYGSVVPAGALWWEAVPGGFISVLPNVDGTESKVNIEALFNAVHKHKDLIKEMFNK